MADQINLSGKLYDLARQDLIPHGAPKWVVTQRPSEAGDPSALMHADWQVWGPQLNSIEDVAAESQEGFLSTDYTADCDTRWAPSLYLGPLVTVLTCSTYDAGAATANANGIALSGTMNATLFLYIIRGRPVAKVKFSDMTLANPGTVITLAEAGTDILYTKSDAATQEISIFMLATAYQKITAVGTPNAADTNAVNTAGTIQRVAFVAPDRISAMLGQVLQGNVLTGGVTMGTPTWTTNATLYGKAILPTGFGMDGDVLIIGTDTGPWAIDPAYNRFYPIMPELDQNSQNCVGMSNWYPLGLIIPLAGGLRYQRYGQGESIGPNRWLMNTSPIQGYPTGSSGSDKWLYIPWYNPVTTDTYILAGRPREAGEQHPYKMSWFCISKRTAKAVNFIRHLGTQNAVRTLPTVVMGDNANIAWFSEGRGQRGPDDTSYTFAASGTWDGTDMRRYPHMLKDIEAAVLETRTANANQTVTLGFSGDHGVSFTSLTGALTTPLNGVVNTNGRQRLLFIDDTNVPLSASVGLYTIKPRLTLATNTSAASPRVEGLLRIYYRLRPIMTNVYQFSLKLDGVSVDPPLQQALNLFALGAAVAVTEDPDSPFSTVPYYLQIDDVSCEDVLDKTSSQQVRIATIKATQWATLAGQ